MKGEQLNILDRLHEGDLEANDKLPEGDIVTFSLMPKGDKMEVRVACRFHVDFAAYESVRDEIMFKILEIKQVIREAEARLDV